MRIFSKFHDYYDINLEHGVDPNIIYQRDQDEFYSDEQPYHIHDISRFVSYYQLFRISRIQLSRPSFYTFSPFVVFVGNDIYKGYNHGSEYYYSYDDVIQKFNDVRSKNIYFGTDAFKRFFEFDLDRLPETKTIKDQMVKDRIPIWYVKLSRRRENRTKNITNMALKEINFQTVLDPYTCFQNISMFLGNLGTSNKEMIEVSNDDKISKHGFDLKQSFRKR
jgi:hypothetical protein